MRHLRKITGRVLSMLLAIVMIATSVPQSALTVNAAEVTDTLGDEGLDDTNADPADVEESGDVASPEPETEDEPTADPKEPKQPIDLLVAGDGEEGGDPVTEFVTFTFDIGTDAHYKVLDSDGTEITKLEAEKDTSAEISFQVQPDTGYRVESVKVKTVEEALESSIKIEPDETQSGFYKITPAQDGVAYTQDEEIIITVAETTEAPEVPEKVTFTFDIGTDAHYKVLDSAGEEITKLEAEKETSDEISFQVQPDTGYMIKSVEVKTEEGASEPSIKIEPDETQSGLYKVTPAQNAGTYVQNETIVITVVETVVEKVTFSFVAGEHYKFLDSAGNPITELKVEKGSIEPISFQIHVDENYTLRNIKSGGDTTRLETISVSHNGNTGTFECTINPRYKRPTSTREAGYTKDESLVATAVEINSYQWKLDYPSDVVDVVVKTDAGAQEVNPETITVSNTDGVDLFVKVKENKNLLFEVYSKYSSESEEDYYLVEQSGVVNDEEPDAALQGYSYFDIGRSFEDTDIKIVVHDAYQLTFDYSDELKYTDEEGKVAYRASVYPVSWDEDMGFDFSEEPFAGSMAVKQGETLYFRVARSVEVGLCSIEMTIEPETEIKEHASDDYGTIYEITPTADTTIHLDITPKTVPVIYMGGEDDIQELSVESDNTLTKLSDKKDAISVYGTLEDYKFSFKLKDDTNIKVYKIEYSQWDHEEQYGQSECKVTKNDDGSYSFNIEIDEYTQKIVFDTAGDRNITIQNKIPGALYEVSNDLTEVAKDSYTLTSDYFYIEVILSDDNQEPVISYVDISGETVLHTYTSLPHKDSNDNTVYQFDFWGAESLPPNTVITIADKNTTNKVVVAYDESALDSVSYTVDEYSVNASKTTDASGKAEEVLTIAYGKKLWVSVNAKENYLISSVQITQDGNDTPVTTDVNSGSYMFPLTVTAETRITINTREKTDNPDNPDDPVVSDTPSIVLMQEKDGKLTEVKNDGSQNKKYYVKPGGSYVAVVNGMEIVKVASNNQKCVSAQVREDGKNIDILVDGLPVGKNAAVTVTGRVASETGKAVTKTLKLYLIAVEDINVIQIPRLNKNNVLSQVIDRAPRYPIYMLSSGGRKVTKGVDFSGVLIDMKLADGVTEDMVSVTLSESSTTGFLQVITSPDAPVDKILATVTLYRYDDDGNRVDIKVTNSNNASATTFKIKATEPGALINAEPTVKVKSATDTTITLELGGFDDGADNYVAPSYVGGQYFRVEVASMLDDEKIPESIKKAIDKPFFFERELPEEDDTEYDDEDEEGTTSPPFTQTVKVTVNNNKGDNGEYIAIDEEFEFDIDVQLVQSKEHPAELDMTDEKVAYRSSEHGEATGKTKKTSYSTTIKLKKGKTQIYTTQQNLVAATLTLDKDAVLLGAVVEDSVSEEEGKLDAYVDDDGRLIISASDETKVGKHTLSVTLTGPSTMYCPTAQIAITVVKGIEGLIVNVPATNIYKQDNKSAGFKAAVTYNPGETAPKTKKVQWSIIPEEEGSLPDDEKSLTDYVTVKNGTVTVNKGLNLEEGEAFSFYVQAAAADYSGNKVVQKSKLITITSTAMDIGMLMVVKPNEAGSYEVAATSAAVENVTTDKLENAELVVVKKEEADDIDIGKVYTRNELNNIQISPSELTVKSSAAKSISLTKVLAEDEDEDDSYIAITPGRPANNIKLTATVNDGGKKSMSMKITIQYKEPAALGVAVTKDGAPLNDLNGADAAKVTFDGTVNTVLTVNVKQQTEAGAAWTDLNGYTNHAVTIKGGKILQSNVAKGKYKVIVTGQSATLTLKYKTKNQTIAYTLTNENYALAKAPKVGITANTSKSLDIGAADGRVMNYSLTGDNYNAAGKYVIIETDAASEWKNDAAWAKYAELKKACKVLDGAPVAITNAAVALNFVNTKAVSAGSYKLTFTFGTLEGNVLKADAKPVSVTLKAASPKTTKGSYTPAKSYTMKASQGEKEVQLTGTGKNLKSVVYKNLQNKNIKGAQRNAENKFLQYFELKEVSENGQITGYKITLKEGVDASVIKKDDCTGYVTYTATYGDNGYGAPYEVTKTVPVTIKLK